ncbi:MAG: DUF1552 domain-containing protein [Oligoflexales bacterium]
MNKNIFKTPITRRCLLNGMSSATLSLLMRPLHSALAQGESAVHGKYFINFFIGNGIVPDYFYPDNGDNNIVAPLTKDLLSFGANGEEIRRQSGYSLNPIANHGLLDKTTVIQGLQYVDVGKLYEEGSNHAKGAVAAFSGGTYRNNKWVHPTLEHILFRHQEMQNESIGPILITADPTAINRNLTTYYSWNLDGNPVAYLKGVDKVFNSVFGNFNPQDTEGGEDPLIGRLESQINLNLEQINRLKKRVGKQGLEYIDAHIEHLVEIERKFKLLAEQAKTCESPSIMQENNYFSDVEDIMSILLSSLQCGRSNIAVVNLQGSGSDTIYGRQIGSNDGFEHHKTSHSVASTELDIFSRMNHWGIDAVARFAKALDSIPDGNGTMLDNSIVCMSHELGRGRGHDLYNVPHIIFGKAGEQYKGGQYLKYGDKAGKGGISVTELLLSHCRAMGIGSEKVQKVGDESVATGEVITELFKNS